MITLIDKRMALVKSVEVYGFKRRWPCHNIPDEVDGLIIEFDANRDLIDIAYLADEDTRKELPRMSDDVLNDMGAAISALVEDVKSFVFDDKVPGWAW